MEQHEEDESHAVRIQITLTPAESKRLIATAVKKIPMMQRALKEGTIIVDRSTTNAYILDQLIQSQIDVSRYASGIVTAQGTCCANRKEKMAMHMLVKGKPHQIFQPPGKHMSSVLMELLEKMNDKDVFIKSANALDTEGNVGVLAASPGGGNIGRVLPVIIRNKVNLLIPVGLEKLIPTTIEKASKESGIFKMKSSMGMPCTLVSAEGLVITETEAIELLCGAAAVPIAAGGVSGAEGAITMVIKGSEKQIHAIRKVLLEIKGEKKINVSRSNCEECPTHMKAPWVTKPCPGFWK